MKGVRTMLREFVAILRRHKACVKKMTEHDGRIAARAAASTHKPEPAMAGAAPSTWSTSEPAEGKGPGGPWF